MCEYACVIGRRHISTTPSLSRCCQSTNAFMSNPDSEMSWGAWFVLGQSFRMVIPIAAVAVQRVHKKLFVLFILINWSHIPPPNSLEAVELCALGHNLHSNVALM